MCKCESENVMRIACRSIFCLQMIWPWMTKRVLGKWVYSELAGRLYRMMSDWKKDDDFSQGKHLPARKGIFVTSLMCNTLLSLILSEKEISPNNVSQQHNQGIGNHLRKLLSTRFQNFEVKVKSYETSWLKSVRFVRYDLNPYYQSTWLFMTGFEVKVKSGPLHPIAIKIFFFRKHLIKYYQSLIGEFLVARLD